MIMKNITLIALSGIFFLSACKKKIDEKYETYSENYISEGYIDYTVKGLTSDSISLNETYHATIANKSISDGGYFSKLSETSVAYSIVRMVDYKSENSMSISFSHNPETGDVSNYFFNMNLYKKIDGNKIVTVNLWTYALLNEILHVTFDKTNSRISGDFSFAYEGSNNKTLEVEGTFDCHVNERFK